MAKITFTGLDIYMEALRRLEKHTGDITKKAIFEGANVVADTVKTNLQNLPTDENWGTQKRPAMGIREEQKDGLVESFGISPLQDDDGFLNVKVGFDGYNSVKTKKYPNGQPNQMIARIAESGTSFSKKTPFMRKAIQASKKIAEKKMEETFENGIKENMKG
mgnify:CR=1 FL=1